MNNSNEYANKLYDNKKYKEAIIFYKRNIEYLLNENKKNYYKDTWYYFNIGYVYAMKENVKKAYIYFNLAWSLKHDDNDCEKALKMLENKMSFSNY